MADESEINTFNFSVKLPVDEQSPQVTSFQVIFNCNSNTFVSDVINSAADALTWAQDELSLFGTWSVSNNVLYLSDSLCEVGALKVQSVIV